VGVPVGGTGVLPASAASSLAVPVHWCFGPAVRAVALFRPAAVVAATLRALRQRADSDVGAAAWAAAAAAGLGALGLADPLPFCFRTVVAPTGHGRVATWTFSTRGGSSSADADADADAPSAPVTRAQLAAVRAWLQTYVCGAGALWGLLFTVRIERTCNVNDADARAVR
jgi:hypothetical protein